MKRYDILLLTFAILISITLHYPLIPHEAGDDSFFIHRSAESIIYYHGIKWLVTPFSLAGYYPYSYPTGVITLLAELSYLSVIPMESAILLFTYIEGVLIVFFAFFLGKKIFYGKLKKWIYVFITAFSPGLLYFTLWTVSTRGFISIIFVLLIFLLFETKNLKESVKSKKFLILFLILLVIAPTIHRLWIFIIPFVIIYVIYKITYDKINICKIKMYYIFPLLLLILMMITLQLLISFYIGMWKYFNVPEINNLDVYKTIAIVYGRLNGPLLFLLPLGVYFMLKHKNEFNLYYITYVIILLPFYLISNYASVISYIIFPIIITQAIIGLSNKNTKTTRLYDNQKLKDTHTYINIIIISLITINIIFAEIIQYYHPNLTNQKRYENFYMGDRDFSTGIWLKYSWHPHMRDNIIINYNPNRILAISGDMSIADTGLFELVNNFTKISKGDVKINDKFWTWPDIGPFVLKKYCSTMYSYWYPLVYHTPTDQWSYEVQEKYNISLVIENKNVGPYQYWSPYMNKPVKRSLFYEKIPYVGYTIYENDKYAMYYWIGGSDRT